MIKKIKKLLGIKTFVNSEVDIIVGDLLTIRSKIKHYAMLDDVRVTSISICNALPIERTYPKEYTCTISFDVYV